MPNQPAQGSQTNAPVVQHNAPNDDRSAHAKRRGDTSSDISLEELVRKEVSKALANLGGQQPASLSQIEVSDEDPPRLELAVPISSQSNVVPSGSTQGPPANTGRASVTQQAEVYVNMSSQDGLERAVSSMLSNARGTMDNNVLYSAKFDLPLGSTILGKVKGKIIAGEYINLYILLDPQYNEDVDLSLGINSDGSRGQSIKLNSSKQKVVNNIHTWTTAMHIYSSIYLPFHTKEIGALMQYIEFIKKMSVYPGFGWRHYDEVFRRARQFDYREWDDVLINQYFAAVSGPKPTNRFGSEFHKNKYEILP